MVTNSGFHNYSDCSFSDIEKTVLGYGAKFRPTNSLPSSNQLNHDLDRFEKRIRWDQVFQYRPEPILRSNNDSYISGFHLPSSRSPPKASRAVEVSLLDFRDTMTSNVDTSRFVKRKPNLTRPERTAMESLNSRLDIKICNADKNLGTAVLNSSDYNAEGARQLEDVKYYRKVASIPSDCTEAIYRFVPDVSFIENELEDILSDHEDSISKKDFCAFFNCFPFKPAKFYLLPKLHKPLGPHGPKGRPIVSCIGYCTSPASRFIDHHLKLILAAVESTTILRDTTMLTNTLKTSEFPDSALLVTADVESLYTNMNWEDTISAVNVILIVLENNYFQFNDVLYHQEHGMAMGTPMAVNVANTFLFIHERNVLSTFKSSIFLFNRFIDDLILVIDQAANLVEIRQSIYKGTPFHQSQMDVSFNFMHFS